MESSSLFPDRQAPGECINLKERFGRRYRIAYEESYIAERSANAFAEDPWLMTIPCQLGHVFPHGGNLLAASSNGRGPTARRLTALDFAIVHQDGDDGVTVLFSAERFAEVAKLLLPKRRRQVSDAERARLAAISAPFRFLPGTQVRKTSAKSTIGV